MTASMMLASNHWSDLISVPVVVRQQGQVRLNRCAWQTLIAGAPSLRAVVDPIDGAATADPINGPAAAEEPVTVETIASEDGPTIFELVGSESNRWFRCVRNASGDLCVTTLIEETALRAAEKGRSDAETMMEWTAELSGVGGWEVDLAANQPMWSDQVKRIHEVPLDEQPPMEEAIDFYAPEARPVITEAVQKAIENGTGWDLELPFITRHGRRIWVRAIGRPEYVDGQCTRLRGTFQDITKRRLQEQAYKDAVHRMRDFERLVETAPTCQSIAGFDGFFLTVNRRWTEIFGHSQEELCSRPFIEFVHPDDVDRTIQTASQITLGGDPIVSFENRYITNRGDYRWLRWYATADVDTQRIYSVAADITQEKERALELQRLASVADRTENGVVVTDALRRIQWVNPAFTKITGYSLEEVLGKSPGKFLQGKDTDPDKVAMIREALRNEQGVQAEVLNYRKDGTPLWASLDIQPVFDEAGRVTNYVSVESDVTDRRWREAQLRKDRDEAKVAAKAASGASEAKSRFLANMSHEIRTPLNGIIGVAELFKDTSLDNEQRTYVDTIHRSGEALLTLISDILDFSKIEANRLELDSAPYSVSDIVHWVKDILRISAEAKSVVLRTKLPPDLPFVVGDEGRVRQVLLNLVSNAVKFTSEGMVDIEVQADRVGDDLDMTISVSDTGSGIPADVKKRLFRPFTQADASTTRRFGGTGLGLSICRSLVELMGGKIDVESTLGVGSRFWFRITQPITSEQPVASQQAAEEMDFTGRSVLLVEDNQINQMVATRMLQKLGVNVAIASDGQEAVEVAAQGGFDLILMDCQMPVMDGYDATRAIRQLGPDVAAVPIVALTANALKGDAERCREAGMNDYLAKPVSGSALAEKLHVFMQPPQSP